MRPLRAISVRGAERSDAELMQQLARGDLAALGELYDAYSSDVWRVVHRLTRGSPDVDDLVQATFLQLPAVAASYDGRASCRAWLCGIAARLVSRWQRGLRRMLHRLTAFKYVHEDAHASTPESEASGNEEIARLAEALDTLSAPKREVFVLVEVEGLSADDVAVVLNTPAATIRTRLFHAKRELRIALERGAS